MAETNVGIFSRQRKNGAGKLILSPELVAQIKNLSPEWGLLKPGKVIDIVDRALPRSLGVYHSCCLSLPGGVVVSMPLSIEKDPTDDSLLVQLNPKKQIKTSTTC